MGFRQIRIAQISAAHPCAFEIRKAEFRLHEAGTLQISSAKDRAGQIRRAKIRPGKIRARQIAARAAFVALNESFMRRQNIRQSPAVVLDALGRAQPCTFSKKTQIASTVNGKSEHREKCNEKRS